jgi:hypothetical protein
MSRNVMNRPLAAQARRGSLRVVEAVELIGQRPSFRCDGRPVVHERQAMPVPELIRTLASRPQGPV